MTRTLALPVTLLLFALALGMCLRAYPVGAEPFVPGQVLGEAQVAAVTAAALAFVAPRNLDGARMAQLAVWGLQGVAALDPRLAVELRADDATKPLLRLGLAGRLLVSRPAPAEGDAASWGEAVGQLVRTSWDVADPVRRAGTAGVIRAFFDEMFNHLDPYSRYAPPEEARAEQARRSGRASLGIDPATARGGVVLRAVEPGGAAFEAGVRQGERLLAIDGVAAPQDIGVLRALLAGAEGSEALLTLRGTDGRVRQVSVTRALLPAETVSAALAGDVVVVRISGFARNTAARLAQELIRFTGYTPRPHGVVLDLRGNRGGVLQQAVAAAAMLQPDGLVASTTGRDPLAAHDFLADGRDLTAGMPVIVLVDGRTASSAEILAAALADQRRAVVVGSSTLGKGLVQAITTLPDGGAVYVSWSRVLAPRGWPIQGLGVLPQLCTGQGAEAAMRQLETLEHGTAPMAAALARHHAARAPLPAAAALEIRATCPASEGRDDDLAIARRLIANPAAYATALLPPRPVASVLGSPARSSSGLTPPAVVRN